MTDSVNDRKGMERNGVRIDRWLWAARFYKTRALAKTAIEAGRVDYHNSRSPEGPTQKPKVSKEVTIGDVLTIHRSPSGETVVIQALAGQRGSATIARQLYQETADSIARREADAEVRRMERAGLRSPTGRPSKHDRRALQRLKQES